MNQLPEATFTEARGRYGRRAIREQVRTSIRTKLMVSHVLVVALSTFIYATGGFFLMLLVLGARGISLDVILRNLPAFLGLGVFVLFNIFLVTLCGIVAASVVSWRMARRLTRQVDELAIATDDFAQGHLERRAEVLSEDELGRLAERFNLLATRLQELDVQRRAFVANISHDLRTPLAIIRGHLDVQMHSGAKTGESDAVIDPHEAFRAIDHEAQTLAKLIDDLFTLSRLEEAALPIKLSRVQLVDLLDDAVRGIRPYALRQSRVSVNSLVSIDVPAVLGDPTRINQIVNNLLHNAVRHTPAGGVVVVSAEVVPGQNRVETTVRDTGVGIAREDLPHIFDRFYQGESTRDPGGTGLGLSIVKQLVEGQGGSVAAASEPGEGTAISFRLPIAS